MTNLPEFAEEHTRATRIRLLILVVSVASMVVALGKFWLFPWLSEFAASANCRAAFGIGGVTLLWYALFAGLPLSLALMATCTLSFRGYKILRDRQTPPLREKVFRPTRIVRGRRARIIGYLHVLAFVPFLVLSIWGAFQAKELSKQGQVGPCSVELNEVRYAYQYDG